MAIDTRVPESPGWWMQRLSDRLRWNQPRLINLNNYYTGNAPLPVVAANVKDAYKAFQRKSRTNFAELVVEAVRDRITPTGFFTAVSGNDAIDDVVQRIYDLNGLDVEFPDVAEAALSMGWAYMIGGPVDPDMGVPLITGEDPRQVVTEHDPARPRRVLAGLKMFHDCIQGADLAYLYLPGGEVHVAGFSRSSYANELVTVAPQFSPGAWDWDNTMSFAGVDPKMPPPIVRFMNRRGVGEFEPHLDLLDRINYMVLQRLVVATMQAFRQRAIKGLPEADDEGNLVDYADVFTADPGALWQVPDGVEFWESQQSDLTPMLGAIKADIMNLAAVTRTPLSYLTPEAASQSAEGAALAREGLVFKVEDRIARFGAALTDVMGLSLRMMGETDRAEKLQVTFASPERRTLSERADASAKAADVPWRTKMTDIWQFAPQVVDLMETQRASDALLASAFAPPPAAPTPTPAPGVVNPTGVAPIAPQKGSGGVGA